MIFAFPGCGTCGTQIFLLKNEALLVSSENMENTKILSKELLGSTVEPNDLSESREISLEENISMGETSESNLNDEEPVTPSKLSKVNSSNSLNSPIDEKATEATEEIGDDYGAAEATEEIGDDYGCEHYKRKSKFVTPCCNKVYTCRFCHDEQETHTVKRKEVTELICVLCDTRQPVQATCQKCHCRFGKYTCLECNLFDDVDKNQYHCDGCGICRLGGRDKFFHCAKCNMCLPVELQNGHTCVENVSHSNCPVCLEDIHTSRIPCHIPTCGHLLHRPCFEDLLHSGHYACPTCQTSLLDMTDLWRFLDSEVTLTPMPPEYEDVKVEILCKDCHEESTVKFHVVGLKCLRCGSYNTCRIKETSCLDSEQAVASGSQE